MSKTQRKVYSVSVVVGSSLYEFLEQNRNNSRFFCMAGDFYLQERVDMAEINEKLEALVKEVSIISEAVKNGVSVKANGIGDNRPQISRGRRD